MIVQDPRDLRRSSRIVISIPVEVMGRDADGNEIREVTTTKYVNKHGGLLFVEQPFPLGAEVFVGIPHVERKQKCKVVWVSKERDERGRYSIGVELERAENFWGVQFPPEDWVAPMQVPLAGAAAGPILPPSASDDHEQRMIRAILNSLIAVLEEKGVVTRRELAEMFKRMSREDASARSRSGQKTETLEPAP